MPALNDPRLLGAAGIVALIGLWLVWATARRVVRIGFFVIAFAAGTAIAWAISGAINKPQPWPMLAAEGLAFAWAWSLFRSKVARVVSAVMLLTVVKFALTYAPGAVKDPKQLIDLPEQALKQAANPDKPAKK